MREKDGFARPTGLDLARSLGRTLVPVVDRARDVRARLGLVPYEVRIIRTRWTGGARGAGAEQVVTEEPILPVPLIQSLDGVVNVMNPVGLDELGTVRVSGISGRYTEQFLRGLDEQGNPVAPDMQFYWEVLFPELGKVEDTGIRRRFTLASPPSYSGTNIEWTVILQLQRGARQNDGRPS